MRRSSFAATEPSRACPSAARLSEERRRARAWRGRSGVRASLRSAPTPSAFRTPSTFADVRPRRPVACLVLAGAVACLLAHACGPPAGPARPTTALAAPDERAARNAAIEAFGLRAWDALASGEPTRVL